jgi:photosystem II stability/assembly factor-like uncharacterized protein
MQEIKLTVFIAYDMTADWDFDSGRSFLTEEEADVFGVEQTRYAELDPEDDPNHWEKYDPHIVVLFEAHNTEAMMSGKYIRSVAIYQRGEKFLCVKSSP